MSLPTFSATDRIKQLNNVDKDVAKLLQSAGLAVKALTKPTASTPAEGLPSQAASIEQQKESFTAATSHYFTLLSSVDVNVRRQIYALEEADILPVEAVTKETPTSLAVPSAAQASFSNTSLSRTGVATKGVVISDGLGNLDVGWLNSRNDNVGKEMKAELWGEAERFVSKLEESKLGGDQEFNIFKGNDEEEGADSSQELDDSGR